MNDTPEKYEWLVTKMAELLEKHADTPGTGRESRRRLIYDVAVEKHGIEKVGSWELYATKAPGYWTLETCKADALQYGTRNEWYEGTGGGYVTAHRNGWFEECCKHMEQLRKPDGYWTLDHCKADALQYGTRSEWEKNSSTAINTARKNGWLDLCCAHMVREYHSTSYWTLDRCKADALQYETRSEWAAQSYASQAARKNGWYEECTAHMEEVKKPAGHWTLERCKADALQYGSRSEWEKNSGTAINTARANGWLEECCAHMERKKKPNGHWTLERCKADALQYGTRQSWRKPKGSGYHIAKARGWLEECCGHMERGREPDWTLERCKTDALEYRTRSKWSDGNPGAYSAARRNDWLEKCCGHMERKCRPDGYWTLERCKADALQYGTRQSWRKPKGSGYHSARKHGWLEECCAHMERMIKPRGYWTFERCKADALQYETRSEWEKNSSTAINTARANGWSEECCAHMPKRAAA